MGLSDTVDSSIFVSVNFRELPETKMFVDIWICGFDTSLCYLWISLHTKFCGYIEPEKTKKMSIQWIKLNS